MILKYEARQFRPKIPVWTNFMAQAGHRLTDADVPGGIWDLLPPDGIVNGGSERATMSQGAKTLYKIKVLDRAIALLDSLSKSQATGLSLIEISEKIGTPRSTVHRFLMVLEEWRFVYKAPGDGKYHLGVKLFELGSLAAPQQHLRQRARKYLESLVYQTEETAHLCCWDDGRPLLLDTVASPRQIRITAVIGTSHAAHVSALGKVFLAHLAEQQLDDVIRKHGLARLTPNTITTIPELKEELHSVRNRGYAVDNSEMEEGLRCIGAPVRDFSGEVVAAVSIAGPAFRITSERVPALSKNVVSAANELSVELGYRPPVALGPRENRPAPASQD